MTSTWILKRKIYFESESCGHINVKRESYLWPCGSDSWFPHSGFWVSQVRGSHVGDKLHEFWSDHCSPRVGITIPQLRKTGFFTQGAKYTISDFIETISILHTCLNVYTIFYSTAAGSGKFRPCIVDKKVEKAKRMRKILYDSILTLRILIFFFFLN